MVCLQMTQKLETVNFHSDDPQADIFAASMWARKTGMMLNAVESPQIHVGGSGCFSSQCRMW